MLHSSVKTSNHIGMKELGISTRPDGNFHHGLAKPLLKLRHGKYVN